jgi:hypothetical protein
LTTINEEKDQLLSNAINKLTEKLSALLLEELMKLPEDMQTGFVLIKSTQLLLGNILCQVASSNEILDKLCEEQGGQIQELTLNCAYAGFADKFGLNKH